MAVGLKKRRKAPISFHFTAGTNAETLSVLIKRSINAQQLRLQLWQRNSSYDGSSSPDESTKQRNPWGDIKIIKGPHGEAKWCYVEGLM